MPRDNEGAKGFCRNCRETGSPAVSPVRCKPNLNFTPESQLLTYHVIQVGAAVSCSLHRPRVISPFGFME